MDIYTLLETNLGYFLLIFVRLSGMFATAPLFGGRNIPPIAKTGLALTFAYIIAPIILPVTNIAMPESLLPYILLIFSEYFVGLILGFVTYIVFFGIQMAGAILDVQIGFGMVNVIDPQLGQQIPLIGNFKYILALLVYLATNCHHLLLTALFDSFTVAPLAQTASLGGLAMLLADITKNIYVIALKIAFPVLISVFLTEVALGILSKTMPQLNIFVVGIPARIIVGIFMLIFGLPFYITLLEVLFTGMVSDLYKILWQLRL
ncbi:MAG: flagellar type III secretion system protein FliR [Sporomusaceae bacterium]|nr:flagellar type III secretion system protein FliR [Sporomusaceae bacterium]